MVIGCYYLTIVHDGAKGSGRVFSSEDEAIMAYSLGQITLQSPIKVRLTRTFGDQTGTKLIDTTLGRLIFNDALPQNLGFVKRECLDDMFQLEVDELVGKKQLSKIVDQCFHTQGEHRTAQVLDKIKALGFKYSTVGAITVSVADIKVPDVKKTMLDEADEAVRKVNSLYHRGLLSEDERYNRVITIWGDCTRNLRDQIGRAHV